MPSMSFLTPGVTGDGIDLVDPPDELLHARWERGFLKGDVSILWQALKQRCRQTVGIHLKMDED